MPIPKLYMMTIYIDSNGAVNFDSRSTDGSYNSPQNNMVPVKSSDYLKWHIGGNQKDTHNPINEVRVDLEQAGPFRTSVTWWKWSSGDQPVNCPECIIYGAPGDYRGGVAVALADGSVKLGEIIIRVQ